MSKPLKFLAGAAAIAAIVSSAAAPQALAAGGDYGPNTCLNGFVWREAFPGDVVCVTPTTRAKAAADNAAAASRRDPNAGYGPYGCRSGYVWRAARASDLVCVAVATRTQGAADNAAAASRRDSVFLSLARWTNGVSRHVVNVTNVNVGRVFVGLYDNGGHRRDYWWVTATPAAGRPGGRVAFRTSALVCSGRINGYFRAMDGSSGRWSVRVPVSVGCKTL